MPDQSYTRGPVRRVVHVRREGDRLDQPLGIPHVDRDSVSGRPSDKLIIVLFARKMNAQSPTTWTIRPRDRTAVRSSIARRPSWKQEARRWRRAHQKTWVSPRKSFDRLPGGCHRGDKGCRTCINHSGRAARESPVIGHRSRQWSEHAEDGDVDGGRSPKEDQATPAAARYGFDGIATKLSPLKAAAVYVGRRIDENWFQEGFEVRKKIIAERTTENTEFVYINVHILLLRIFAFHELVYENNMLCAWHNGRKTFIASIVI